MPRTPTNRLSELNVGFFKRVFRFVRKLDRRLFLAEVIGCFAVIFVLVLMVRQTSKVDRFPTLSEGRIAPATIRVPKSIEVQDTLANEAEKARITAKIPLVFDLDTKAATSWATKWKMGIEALAENPKWTTAAAAKQLSERWNIRVRESDVAALRSAENFTILSRIAEGYFSLIQPYWIADDKVVEGGQTIELINFETSAVERVDLSVNRRVVSRSQAEALLSQTGARRLIVKGWSPSLRASVERLLLQFVNPNMNFNRQKTEERYALALSSYQPIMRAFSKGEVIVREGQRVNRETSEVLKALNARRDLNISATGFWYEILFGTLSLWLILIFLRRQYPKVMLSTKNLVVSAGMLMVSLAAFKLVLIFELDLIAQRFSHLPISFFLFLIPVAAPAMILRLLVPMSQTLIFVMLYSLGLAILLDKAALYGVFVLTACLTGAIFVKSCRTRAELYRSGLWTALVCGISAAVLVMAWGGDLPLNAQFLRGLDLIPQTYDQNLVWAFLGGAFGGWLSAALTLVLTPILETLLDYTTDLKLLELARMDHPLLRELVLKAPGTYHHSIIVGSLVEAGAEAIGANALLVRVGAYYHDVGKIGRAEYFVENQTRGFNPHDAMKPQLSAKIIISHVKEGRLMAEKYKLGRAISDFIEQHHGKSKVDYFYQKAKNLAEDPRSDMDPEEIREEDFCYPGPNPQSREAAILALADACEASTRSLVEPTPARIEGMINKIVSHALEKGLLSEADITLREVHLVTKAFLRILLSIHHNRVQYPGQENNLPPMKSAEGDPQTNLSLIKR
jgi:cyclic-di-AMP phosphodiesterase PgpH